MKWFKVDEAKPDAEKYVITWNGEGYRICVYKKVLTWRGRKFKFVNVMSHGFWNDDETHWTYFPEPPAT
jgi:hypothetical protein